MPHTHNWLHKVFPASLALLAAVLVPGSLAAVEPSQPALEALSLLHQGRFDEASSAFSAISRDHPTDPEGPLFEALTVWWRLLDLPDDPDLRPVLDDRLGEAIRRGEALLEGPHAQRGRLLAGTAALLAAQTKAFTGSYLDAGRSARRGHDLLEEALRVEPGASDARFALGAYKYFAARLPWLVRFLRFFVRLPGGNAEEGLEDLATAAAGGSYFRTESTLLLAYIHSGDDENDLRTAINHLRSAATPGVESPLLAAIEARFLFQVGRLSEAERRATEAIEGSGRVPGVAPAIPALARIRLALVQYYQYRPAEAGRTLEMLNDARASLPPDAISRLEGLEARLRKELAPAAPGVEPVSSPRSSGKDRVRMAAAAPLPRGAEAVRALDEMREGRPEEAARRLQALLESTEGGDPVVRYHMARAWQVAGDHDRARRELTTLLRSGMKIPKTLRGWTYLRMGAALEASGLESQARSFYRRASSLKGFVFRRAGRDRLTHPSESFSPEG